MAFSRPRTSTISRAITFGHRQTAARHHLDDQLLLRAGTAGRRTAGWAGWLLSGLRHATSTFSATPRAQLRPRRELRDQRSPQADESLSLQGIGVYARYQVTEPAGWPCATNDSTTRDSSAGSSRFSTRSRLTAEYKFADGFLMRGEFRRDWSNEPSFTTSSARRPPRPSEHRAYRPGVVVRQQVRAPGDGEDDAARRNGPARCR